MMNSNHKQPQETFEAMTSFFRMRLCVLALFASAMFAPVNATDQPANNRLDPVVSQNPNAARTPVIAHVFGHGIRANPEKAPVDLITGPLFEKYVTEQGLEPTQEELESFHRFVSKERERSRLRMEETRQSLVETLQDGSLSDTERAQKTERLKSVDEGLQAMAAGQDSQESSQGVAREFVQAWKLNNALYAQYGGRVIFQQTGIEPFDAFHQFLKEQEASGAFAITDEQYRKRFWHYYENTEMHQFLEGPQAEQMIKTPVWEMMK